MNKHSWCFWRCLLVVVCLVAASSLNAQVTEAPIEEFLSAQGQSGSQFFPPIPDYVGWGGTICKSGGLSCLSPHFDATRFCWGNFALVDYAGVAERYLTATYGDNASSGTVVEGKVSKRPVGGGIVEVTVDLHTKNALTFVMAPSPVPPDAADACGKGLDWVNGPILLGYRINELPPPPLTQRALGESFFHISFRNGATDPLPDLVALFYTRYSDIREYTFHAVATGPLTAAFGAPGAPGRVNIVQAANGFRSNLLPALVDLRQAGK